MKNFIFKITKSYAYLIFFLSFMALLLCLPWSPPVELTTSESKGSLLLSLQKSNYTETYQKMDLSEQTQPIKLYTQKVLSYELSDSTNTLKISSIHKSQRWNLKVFFSILVFSGIMTALSFYFTHLIQRAKELNRLRTFTIMLFSILTVFSGLLYLVSPGLMNYDSFDYYLNAAMYDWSEFSGFFYSNFLMSLFQLFPYPWIVPFFNVALISVFISHLCLISYEFKTQKYFFLSLSVFYLYPVNIFMALMTSRDSISHWLLCVFLIELFRMYSQGVSDKKSLKLMSIATLTISLFRPETVYVVLPSIIIYAIWAKQYKRWTLVTSTLVMLFLVIKPVLYYLEKIDDAPSNHYQTTLLINPLSYILKNLYPDGLPSSVDEKLGSYFKNEYLLKHQIDNDINPYHEGGVNFNSSTEDYHQFKREAFKIMRENPLLWIKNRVIIAKGMFGFAQYTYLGSNHYNEENDFFIRTRKSLSFQNYEQNEMIKNFIEAIDRAPAYISKSYAIPFIFIIISLILCRKSGWYWKIFLIIFVQTGLIVVTAPADFFKYNYALWLFCVFSFPCVIWERNR